MNKKITGCHVMAKPTGSICNLDCSYCFYLEKEKLYPSRSKKYMDDATLEHFIQQHINAQSGNHVEFAWQGGEPTLAGIDYYQAAVELQKKYGQEKRITNSFQTNGVLINDEWCDFFKQHNFLIGISIDGPAEFHDAYRVSRSGKGTHHKVIDCINLLKSRNIEFNTLTVVNDLNVEHAELIYTYLKSIGSTFMQFIPLVEQEAQEETQDGLILITPESGYKAQVSKWSVRPNKFGAFLNTIFDKWVLEDIGKIYIQMFESALSSYCTGQSQICTFSETCGHAFALESNGDLYNCDHYVYPEHKLGNINHTNISTLNNSQQAIDFGTSKKSKLSNDCKSCPYLTLCNGGCPKQRFNMSSSGIPNHNYLCSDYYSFFQHTERYFNAMQNLIKQQRSPTELMHYLKKTSTH